ncbi:MAG: acyloxyacyl hydrolase [Pseudomonadota bacterium]
MKHTVLSLCLAGALTSGHAVALDGYTVEIGGNDNVQSVRVGMIRQWDRQWLSEGRWHLTGYWEAQMGLLDSDRPAGRSVAHLGFAPVLRLRPNALGGTQPYWDIAVALNLLSRTRLDDKHDFHGALQFAPLVGVGVTFGEKSQYDLGYRFQRISNEGFSDGDTGLNLHQVRLTYLY